MSYKWKGQRNSNFWYLKPGYHNPCISRREPQDLMMDVILSLVPFLFTIFLSFPFKIRLSASCYIGKINVSFLVDRSSWKSDYTSRLRDFVIVFLFSFGMVKTT